MNREIKFRVWNQDNQEFQFFVFYNGAHWSHNIEAYSTNAFKELQQYTGLKDKVGKEIYEGEIIFNDDRKEYGVVEWDLESAQFITKYEREIYPLCNTLSNLYYSVGNVCENTELIK